MKAVPILFLCLTAPLLYGQASGTGTRNNPVQNSPAQGGSPSPSATATAILMWRCNLPAGSYSVALRAVVSVSSHEYIVNGVARVTEVNIDTIGNGLARFYYIEPMTPTSPIGLGNATIDKFQQLVQQGAALSGQDASQKVLKDYPTTTHAHTIEYRVTDKNTLSQLYMSAEGALRLNQNTIFDGSGSTQTDPTAPPQPPNTP